MMAGGEIRGGYCNTPLTEDLEREKMASNDVEVSCCLDYIRFSAGRENSIVDLLPNSIPGLCRTGDILDHGSYGYNRTMPLAGGGRIMYHDQDHGMKYCVELAGEALADVRRDGFDEEQIIGNCFSGRVARVQFSRVDVAFDVKNAEGSIEELYQSWNKGETKTLAKQATWIESVKSEFKANTVYFGARESAPRFLRAYDKAAQQKIMGVSWLRLEGEIKKRRATPFAWSVLKNGKAAAGRRELKDAIKTRVAWVIAALTGELSERVEVPRPEARPNEFVKGMIIPFLKNHSGELTDETKKLLLVAVEDYISVT